MAPAKSFKIKKEWIPWLIGGGVVVGGLLLLGGDAQAGGAAPPGVDPKRAGGPIGPDGIRNSSRQSARERGTGRVEHPPIDFNQYPQIPPLPFPVPGYRVKTQGFGWVPWKGKKEGRFHSAVDIGAPRGTPIIAVADGQVTYEGDGGSCGVYLTIKHNDPNVPFDWRSNYCHMDVTDVDKGDWVKKGQKIGEVGSTGNASDNDPHLHFNMFIKWPELFDPGPWIGLSGAGREALLRYWLGQVDFYEPLNITPSRVYARSAINHVWMPHMGAWAPVQTDYYRDTVIYH